MKGSFYAGEAIFSAGGVLVDNSANKVFLVFKQKSMEWLLPKGHLETGETIEESAEREIFEETGYKNDIRNLLSAQIREDMVDPMKHKIIFWFLSLLKSNERSTNTQMSDESFSGKWFSKKEAVGVLKYGEDKKLIEKAFESLD